MEEQEILNFEQKNKRVTFGSCISLSLEHNSDCFISSEGFIDPKLYVKRFDLRNPKGSFFSSVFRILPFSSISSFDKQNKLYHLLKNFSEESKKLANKPLALKKNEIQDLRSNLDVEINLNMNLYKKLKGSPVNFETSHFQLVHMATMKYLTLNIDSTDNLFFELTDYPNEHSFFKFMPTLKVQKKRNNNVYNEDIVTLSSTSSILNRNPTLYTEFISEAIGEPVFNDANHHNAGTAKIVADIENSRKWKIKLYDHDDHEHDKTQFLKVGDVVWLQLSEKKFYLRTNLQNDPFTEGSNSENFKFSHVVPDHFETSPSRKMNKKPDNNIKEPLKGDKEEEEEMSMLSSSMDDNRQSEEFYQERILNSLELEFKEVVQKKLSNLSEMTTNGLWVIEPPNIYEGGILRWE